MTDHQKISIAIVVAALYAVQQNKISEQVLFDAGFYPADLKLWKKGKGADRAKEFVDKIYHRLDGCLMDYIDKLTRNF